MSAAPGRPEPAPTAAGGEGPPVSAAPDSTLLQAAAPPMPRPTLLQTLRRAQLQTALLSMVVLGLALSLAALLALRSYAVHNLELIARTIAYTVEAAVVFRDRPAAQEQLTRIAQREALALARVVDEAGRELARYEQSREQHAGLLRPLGDHIVQLLMPEATVTAITYQNRSIATVQVRSDGAVFARFLAIGGGCLLLCMLAIAFGVRQWSRRIQRDILAPLQTLSAMTQLARTQRSCPYRTPASPIAELHQLGQDFNALLDEVESHQALLAQENRSLTHLAHHDSLTGLPNRAQFQRRLARVLQDAEGRSDGIGVLYLDNDHFKQINDRYGHAVGDLLLMEVAQRVRSQLRETDLVARLGGDEFAVLLAPVHQVHDAVRIAEKINAAVAVPMPPPHQHIVPSVSIGIAVYPRHGRSAEELLHAADHAMYAVKNTARGGHHVLDPEQDLSNA